MTKIYFVLMLILISWSSWAMEYSEKQLTLFEASEAIVNNKLSEDLNFAEKVLNSLISSIKKNPYNIVAKAYLKLIKDNRFILPME